MTEQQIKSSIADYKWLSDNIKMIGLVVAKIRKTMYKHQPEECYEDFQIDGEEVTAHFSESVCGCCSNEEYYVSFPISYLWIDNFSEVETLAQVERNEREARLLAAKKKREEEAAEVSREQKDWATFQRLKKKFKDVPEREDGR